MKTFINFAVNIKIFVYFIQNLSPRYEKFTFIFYKLKNFPRVFFEFRWISRISLKFPEIFITIYSNPSNFPEYFLKIFTLKICLNITCENWYKTGTILAQNGHYFGTKWALFWCSHYEKENIVGAILTLQSQRKQYYLTLLYMPANMGVNDGLEISIREASIIFVFIKFLVRITRR